MISILLPSRGRPRGVSRLVESIIKTADGPKDIEVIVAVDKDDPEYTDYLDLITLGGLPISVYNFDRMVLSQYWNECYKRAKGDILMHAGDDIIFRTKGWDTAIKQVFEEYPDNIVFVFGNDGSPHNGNFGTHGFIHRKWAETVGYFVPPYFSSDYNDSWLNDVARKIGRHRHVPILTEHMHPDFGKAPMDKTYEDRVERHQKDNVGALYESKAGEREADAQKLKEVMQ